MIYQIWGTNTIGSLNKVQYLLIHPIQYTVEPCASGNDSSNHVQESIKERSTVVMEVEINLVFEPIAGSIALS